MDKLFNVFMRFNVRERMLLILSLLVLFYFGMDKLLISPFLKSIKETKERLETQEKLLNKYYSFAANKKQYEAILDELKKYYEKLQGKFLSEETEELASAKLQEIINNLATKSGLVVSRSTALKKEIINKNPHLIALSINFEINDLDSTQKLQTFLHDIEYNTDKLLFINSLRIKTLGLKVVKGASISSTLTAIAIIGKKS